MIMMSVFKCIQALCSKCDAPISLGLHPITCQGHGFIVPKRKAVHHTCLQQASPPITLKECSMLMYCWKKTLSAQWGVDKLSLWRARWEIFWAFQVTRSELQLRSSAGVMSAATGSKETNRGGCIPTKLSLWTWKSELKIIFVCHKTLFLFWYFFQPFNNVKAIFNSQAVQKQMAGQIGLQAVVCPDLEQRHKKH